MVKNEEWNENIKNNHSPHVYMLSSANSAFTLYTVEYYVQSKYEILKGKPLFKSKSNNLTAILAQRVVNLLFSAFGYVMDFASLLFVKCCFRFQD